MFAGEAAVPVVCVVLGGGPKTVETLCSEVDKGTLAIIVEVYKTTYHQNVTVLSTLILHTRCTMAK